jgi:transcriptional regulator with XRE-family HTH domain
MAEFTLRGSSAKPLKLRMRVLREARGLTQAQLAERAGCNVVTIIRLERGNGHPNRADLERFAKALSVTLQELTGPTEDTEPDPGIDNHPGH